MTKPVALPLLPRKRGNPNWGKPFQPGPVLATEFEIEVKHLRLTPHTYICSVELRRWCERNCNRVYVPEWLLQEWGIPVDPKFASFC
jgi:hypothetical protein